MTSFRFDGTRDLDEATLSDGQLHFWWGARVRSDALAASGSCGVRVEARGESAGGEGAVLALRLVVAEQLLVDHHVALADDWATYRSPPVSVVPPGGASQAWVRVELAFVNDGSVAVESAVGTRIEDRNAHVRWVALDCAP